MTAAREGQNGAPAPDGVPAPEPLPAEALDSHCHLEMGRASCRERVSVVV